MATKLIGIVCLMACMLAEEGATNPIVSEPRTLYSSQRGKLRSFNFTVNYSSHSPDGVTRPLILVNDMYPGPTISLDLGDTVSITVNNQLDEGTAIHWHGIAQKGTPQFDGVPFITQCPIAPGKSFTYTFTPEAAGTTMWHSHYSAQYTDGLFGALIIHGPKTADYDIDLGPIFVSDYTHTPYASFLLPVYDRPPTFLPLHNNLINGLNPYNCTLDTSGYPCSTPPTPYSTVSFTPQKKHLLRIMNTGGSATQKVSIDGHKMIVVANDFVPVKPYEVDVVTVGVGQRTDVIVEGCGKEGATYWLRADIDVECSNATVYQADAKAVVRYTGAPEDEVPTTEGWTWDSMECRNDPLRITEPLEPMPVPEPTFTDVIDITASPNGTGHLVFFMGSTNFRANYSASVLAAVAKGELEFPEDYSMHSYGSNTSIRLIIRNFFPVMHNMHLHGHTSYWVLAEGRGDWDGTIVRPENPQRRDGQQLMMGTPDMPAYIVIQFEADNPGVWALHCHYVVHGSAGMYWNIIERPDLIKDRGIEDTVDSTCGDWNKFAAKGTVDQFDSGLRIR